MMVDISNIRKSICKIGKLLYDRGLTDSSGGNISVRDQGLIYVSPKRAGHDHQWEIEEDSIIVTDLCKVPLIGQADAITREAICHYYIYQNFADINAVIHSHPTFMMAFGAAHMKLPAISEGTRAILGHQPITNTPEVVPGSKSQAEAIIENFNKRREKEEGSPLICNLPFHGAFSAGGDLNDAFLYTEVANNCAKILIYRQMMFGNDPKADFEVHEQFTKGDFATIDMSKEVCEPGFVYKDATGRETVYKPREKDGPTSEERPVESIINRVTEEVLKQINRKGS